MDINLEKKRIYALVGENGVGKTTLLRGLAGLINFNEKRYKFGDYFYFIGEEMNVLDYLTGRDNLILIAKLKNLETSSITPIIKLNNLEPFIDNLVLTYSKGMLEKLKLSIGLLVSPKVLLLDEPFTSLDLNNIELLQSSIKEFVSSGEHSVILSTHSIDIINVMADEILILSEGKLSRLDKSHSDIKKLKEIISKNSSR
ncbi:ATP-binding cassette domain-containing protein [Niallia taxi]|uniref:ATP-binding cassette domain-containing protein n=1 Tax=Niallia taxi TaxID=2499688 RepID=UPI0021A8239A|nr:ATP-binding cassette domain-containing protein [Niallia taxi]MCT2344616.1 ATP-binding cassette domain-containing protein [Niallia taxi]